MFLCDDYNNGRLPERLPDITMYAGDTTPWSIVVFKPNGNPYPFASLEGSTCRIVFMQYSVTNGLNAHVRIVDPVLTKEGTLTNDPAGTGIARFEMTTEDTIGLRGKYIYQVTIGNNSGDKDDNRVRQGLVTIFQNIDR